MPISAGTLNERVKMQTMAYSVNEIGEQVLQYKDLEPFCEFPASVKFVKSYRQLADGQMWEPTTIMVTTRYSATLLKVRRLIWNDNIYDVDGVPNGDRTNRTITYTCSLHDDGLQTEEITETDS